MPDNVTAPLHKFLAEGLSVDQAIREMQRIGFTRELTAVALRRVLNCTQEQAEARVDSHPAWRG